MKFSYCERVTATITSPVHIRILGAGGRHLGGGIIGKALCEKDVTRGWDLASDVTTTIATWERIPQDQPGRLCLDCVKRYRAI